MTGSLACAAVPLAGGAAYAAASAQLAAVHVSASSLHAAHARHRTTTLTTRTSNVHIRSRAKLTKRSTILDTLPMRGSKVAVKCYKTGASVSGDTTWYRTVSPRAGFISGHELDISREPASGVTACKVKK